MRQLKKNIYIKLLIDSREKDLSFIEKFKFDKKFDKDKIKIVGYEIRSPLYPLLKETKLPITSSTGDVSIAYSFDEITWYDSSLSIELKKNSDLFTSLYSNYKRFCKEIERGKDLDFYLVYDMTTAKLEEHIDKLKNMRKLPQFGSPQTIIYNRLIELVDDGVKILYCSKLEEIIRRIVKRYVVTHKLQYQ